MAEVPASTFSEDGLPVSCKLNRTSGHSSTSTGVSLHQLRRLFRIAGDRDAEHRAKLMWQRMDEDTEGAEEEKKEEGEETEDEAGLAQALVGLRARARKQVSGQRDTETTGGSEHISVLRRLYLTTLLRITNPMPGLREFLLLDQDDIPENQSIFKSSAWRLDLVRQEGVRDSERYLHHINH